MENDDDYPIDFGLLTYLCIKQNECNVLIEANMNNKKVCVKLKKTNK